MKIIVSGTDFNTKETLKTILEEEGYKITAVADDGFDAIKLCRQYNPDVVILSIDMPLLDGISVAQIIKEEDIAGAVLFILSDYNKKIIKKIKSVEAKGCIFTPVDKKQVMSTIELTSETYKLISKLKEENKSLEQKFEDRKVIDKAKGILMLNSNITEDEAYNKIRKYSMEKRVTMREIAEFMIISNKFKN